MSRTNLFQRVEDYFEQRKAFRLAALASLRKREGLPSPVDECGVELETHMDDLGNVTYHNAAGEKIERVMFAGTGKDGKPGSFAIGKRKQESRELADVHWNSSDPNFEILDVAEDGRRLEDELKDLDRDSSTFEIAQRISYGDAGEQAPELHLANTSDEEIDETLQKFLKRGL